MPRTAEINPAKEQYYNAMAQYQGLVAEVCIVRSCLLGGKPGFRTSYIWNVLTENFTPEQMLEHPRFTQLSDGAADAITQSAKYTPLRIANIVPSHVAELRIKCRRNGVKLSTATVINSRRKVSVLESSLPQGEHTPLDILIGGLKPADPILQAVQETAAKAVKDFADEDDDRTDTEVRADIEEVHGFSVLDKLKDRRAGAMLKDIAWTRNAYIEGDYVRVLELRAEPVRVLQKMVLNVFDERLVSGITELDVRDAIESGTFGKL